VLRIVNRLLTADLSDARFVTCFFGLLDPLASRLVYASAGHGPMIFYDRSEDTFKRVAATALPLGVTSDVDFDTVIEHTFAPGDIAAITTDGFFEAVNAQREQFGMQRMMELLRRGRDPFALTLARHEDVLHTGTAQRSPAAAPAGPEDARATV